MPLQGHGVHLNLQHGPVLANDLTPSVQYGQLQSLHIDLQEIEALKAMVGAKCVQRRDGYRALPIDEVIGSLGALGSTLDNQQGRFGVNP